MMHVSIQSLEITYNRVPYRFIVKRVTSSTNEVTFHCWAPEDNLQAKELLSNHVILFEWDHKNEELRTETHTPLHEELRAAIRQNFSLERA